MAYVFLIFICVFTIACGFYLIKNNFASETLEIIFPAVGAILLSTYLGFKSIVINAPEPKKFGTTVGILHDSANGTVSGMAPRSISYYPRLEEFRGTELISDLPDYNVFQSLNLNQAFQDISGEPNSKARAYIEHLLEYAILRWFTQVDMRFGYVAHRGVQLISAAGTSGGVLFDLASVQTSLGDNEVNPFIKAEEVVLFLPKGSAVKRSKNDMGFDIEIITKHSHLRIRQAGYTREALLSSPINEDARKIYSAIGLSNDTKSMYIDGFTVEFEVRQFPFTRFSEQGKKEAEWLTRIESQFEKDFSWERLRNLYTAK